MVVINLAQKCRLLLQSANPPLLKLFNILLRKQHFCRLQKVQHAAINLDYCAMARAGRSTKGYNKEHNMQPQ